MLSNRRRWIEPLKTVLIVLLVCLAVYLIGRSQLYNGRGKGGWVQALTALISAPDLPTDTVPGTVGTTRVAQTAVPVRIVITGAREAGRWGAQYNADSAAFFDLDGGILAEALSTADLPYAVSEHAFREALAQHSIYFDFLGRLPLRSLCIWLANAENPALAQGAARRLALALTETGDAALYYINEEDGMYYACALPGDFIGRLTAIAAERRANGAQFAFEAGDAFDRVSPYMLLLPEPPRPQRYASRMPLGQLGAEVFSAPMAQLLRALSFNPGLASGYPVTGGAVIREGSDTLRVSSTGVVSYELPEGGTGRYPAADPLAAACAIAEGAVGAMAGSARLYLMDMREEGGQTTVCFGYCLDGAQVIPPDGMCAAEFVISGGVISRFTLLLRMYEPTGSYANLLPELRAVAAMDALGEMGSELVVLYEEDDGGEWVAFWGAMSAQ